MFDILTYEKGAAVLRMLEQFLGAENFRKGISLYLNKHKYANAETTDLWDALEESTHEPVRTLMDSWIFQQGFPVVNVAAANGGRALKISQRRFFYAPPENPEPQLYHVPIMTRVRTEKGVAAQKLLLTEGETTLDLAGPLGWAPLNDTPHELYRLPYSPTPFQPL